LGTISDWWTGANKHAEIRADIPLPSDPSTAIIPPARSERRETVSTGEALSLSMVYRAVQILAVSAKQISMDAYRDGTEVTPQPSIVRQPNIDSPRAVFVEETTVSLATNGNAYWLIDRDGSGRVSNLSVLNPLDVQVNVTAWGTTTNFQYKGKTFRPEQIKHLKLTRVPGSAKGLGPIQAAQHELRGALDAQGYASNWFQDGGVPTGVLTSDQQLNSEQAKQIKDAWNTSQGGQRSTAVLGSGMSYAPVFLSPSDANWIEVRQFDTTAIARMFGVPASLMLATVEGNSQSYANVSQDWLGFTRFSLLAYLSEIEEALSDLLPRGQRVRFNVEALLRADVTTRYAAHKTALEGGWMSVNEIRDIEGLAPIPNGGFPKPSNTPTPSPSAEVVDDPEADTEEDSNV
jgi:HK97 family phage portal protein